MKHFVRFSLLIYILLALDACKKDCGPDVTRPALSSDALKWVEVADQNPKFKIKNYDASGNLTITDTVDGSYTLSNEKKSELVDDCYYIYYEKRTNTLSIPYGFGEYGMYFEIDNYLTDDYRGKLHGYEPYIYSKTTIDTALINGKIYYEVYKFQSTSSIYYYAKGIGLIFKKTNVTIELLP